MLWKSKKFVIFNEYIEWNIEDHNDLELRRYYNADDNDENYDDADKEGVDKLIENKKTHRNVQ